MRDFFHLHPGLNERVFRQHVSDLDESEIFSIERKLALGVPLAYLLGRRYFYRAEFSVDDRVLIPRMESELILEILQQKITPAHKTLVDIGAGSGCLGLSCAMEFSWLSQVILTDLSKDALIVAKKNQSKLSYRIPSSCQVEFSCEDCLKSVPSVAVVVANPPYIQSSTKVHPQTKCYEPHLALFTPGKGEFYWQWFATFFDRVCESIEKKGVFVMEGETSSLPRLKTLLEERSAVLDCKLEKDLSGRNRFLVAQF